MWRVGIRYLPVTQKIWEKILMQLGEKVYKLWTSQREGCLAFALTPDQLDLELGRRALCPGAVLSLVLSSARHHPHPPTPSQMMNHSSLPSSELVFHNTVDTCPGSKLSLLCHPARAVFHQLVTWELWQVHSTGSLGRKMSK